MFKNILFMLLLIIGSNQAWSVDDYVIYYHNDALGSPVAATDSAGQVLWKEHYHPYGEKAINDQKSFNEKLGYTGKSFDRSTGLSYYGARYYDPVIGRFMGIDPIGFQESNIHSFNRYAYANNNPHKFVDPDGKSPKSAAKYLGRGLSFKPWVDTNWIKLNSKGEWVFTKTGKPIPSVTVGGTPKQSIPAGYNARADWAQLSGMLSRASRGKGNFTIGSATPTQASVMGKTWVGKGHKLASDGKTLLSKDGMRQYRPPTYKPNLNKVQANFEQRFSGQKTRQWQSNGHLNIKK